VNSVVSLKEVTKRFGDFVAVNDVSLEVGRGEIFGFLGPNGSGKSTTIKMICGILAPTAGKISVLGCDTVKHRRRVVNEIGYMSQKFSLYPTLTVEENLGFYAGVYGLRGRERSRRIDELLEEHGIVEQRKRITSDLPVGWKQRLALASALLHKPGIIFLDEPTGGVDPSSRREFWDIIVEMAEAGTTIFVTTHYMDEAEYCDRIGLILRGDLIALGSADDLKKQAVRGLVFEVSIDNAIKHMEKIARLPDVDDVTIHGKDLHIMVKHETSDPSRVFADIEAGGVSIKRRREIPPSLEDVFVTLMR